MAIIHDSKKLVMIGKSGPAFEIPPGRLPTPGPSLPEYRLKGGEVEKAHELLDGLGIPRMLGGMRLGLPERIEWLHGRLISAQLAIEFAAHVSTRVEG